MENNANIMLAISALMAGAFAILMSLGNPVRKFHRIPIFILVIALVGQLNDWWDWPSTPEYFEEVALAASLVMIAIALATYTKRELFPEARAVALQLRNICI